jgi:hypothetical protein
MPAFDGAALIHPRGAKKNIDQTAVAILCPQDACHAMDAFAFAAAS